MKRLVVSLLAAAVACGEAKPKPIVLADAPKANWLLLNGGDFTVRYPPDATLPMPDEPPVGGGAVSLLRGPLTRSAAHPEIEGPAYELLAVGHPAAYHKLTAAQWVDSVRRDANAGIGPENVNYVNPPDSISMNGVPALRLRLPCGGCKREAVYASNEKWIVVLSYEFDPKFPGDSAAQRRLYDAIMSTYAWKP